MITGQHPVREVMKIIVFEGTGGIGQRMVAEVLSR